MIRDTSVALSDEACVSVPEMMRVAKACEALSAIVFRVPVRVTVDVPAVNVEDAPLVSHVPEAVMLPVVSEMEFADASFIVTFVTVIDADVPTSAPPAETVRLAPPVMLFPAVVKVPRMERVPFASTAPPCVTVPVMVRLWNPLAKSRMRTVVPAPDNVTVLVPLVNPEPGPEVSQDPLRVHAPLVSAIVPDVPPVIDASTRVTVEASAVRIPESPTVREPPIRGRFAVASAVVDPAVS